MNEDDVLVGVANFLKHKNRHRDNFIIDHLASAKEREHGIDLKAHAMSGRRISNRYYIEAKGTLKAKDNTPKSSQFETEFRWAVSQIILQMTEFSGATVFGIAVPKTEKANCLRLMRHNKGLKKLKIRLYLTYRAENGEFFAEELTPKEIYKKQEKD